MMADEGYGILGTVPIKPPRNFRLEWAVALLFGTYEMTVSYFLVIISMAYYKKVDSDSEIGDALTHLCGNLLPDWQSVAVLFTFYTFVYAGVVSLNTLYIRSTESLRGHTVEAWHLLFHPLSRLVIGLTTFFLTCGFSETTQELRPINKLSYILCQIVMVVDAIFCFFFIYQTVRRNEDHLSLATSVWGVRQLIVVQLKYSIVVCFLSTHINIILQVLLLFCLNTMVYVAWSRLVKSGRKTKKSGIYRENDRREVIINNN